MYKNVHIYGGGRGWFQPSPYQDFSDFTSLEKTLSKVSKILKSSSFTFKSSGINLESRQPFKNCVVPFE